MLLIAFPVVVAVPGCADTADDFGDEQPQAGYDEVAVWETRSSGLLVGPETGASLLAQGATLIDARSAERFSAGSLEGAVNLPWQVFVDGSGSGEVSGDDARLGQLLNDSGVRTGRPILVYGDWNVGGPGSTWGEEGRVLWTLEYLGHDDVRVLIGGYEAGRVAGLAFDGANSNSTDPAFVVRRAEAVRATTQEVKAGLDAAAGGRLLLDAREAAEYGGDVLYGESRGGHIPGAAHLWWFDLFGDSGALLPPESILGLLAARGYVEGIEVVPYCTGGIRSGFVYLILRALGVTTANYDASMWAWTADATLPLQ